MPKICTVAAALADGYTREVFATSDDYDHFLLVKPDVEFDSRFLAYDTDQHEWIKINGWLYSFEEAPGSCIGPHDGIMRREA